MKDEISSLELYYVVKEFQDLIGGRIDKVYQNERDFLFTMHVRGKGKKLLKITPKTIYTTNFKETFPETPHGFCLFLRKYLGGAFIREIKQKNFERIIEIVLEAKENKYFMMIELFGNGNLILCDEEYKIKSALESHRWRARTVRGGITYEFPPEQNNVLSMDEKQFKKILSDSKSNSIVKKLAIDISLGGLYSEELCLLSKVNKTKEKITQKETTELYVQLKKLLSKKIKANIVGADVLPFELKLFDKEEKKYFDTFNEAADAKFSEKIKAEHENKTTSVRNKALDKIKVIIDNQEQTINGMKTSAAENQRKGEFIYENYDKIKSILEDMNKAREKFSWAEIKEKLKGNKTVKKIDEKEASITIEI